jgi:hypothetical protein
MNGSKKKLTGEIGKHLEMNENKNTAYQKLLDAAEETFRGKNLA